jgi:hypothetical protein
MNQKVKKLRWSLVTVIILAAVAGFTSCEKVDVQRIPFDPTATWHFQTDIQPIFNAKCITCHNGTKSPDLRDKKAFSALSLGGYLLQPAENSRLYLKTANDANHIPRTSDTEKLKILNWIKQGALNN